MLALAIFYAVSPIDLIPDIILIIEFRDHIIIVPGLIILALHFIALHFVPKDVVEDCRLRASG